MSQPIVWMRRWRPSRSSVPGLTENILEALAGDPNAVTKMVGRRVTTLLAAEKAVPGSLLVLPIKDHAPDVPLRSSVSKLISWNDTDRYRLQAVRHDNGLEILLTYD